VIEDRDGVEVVLDDGTVERGDMVLGCDGVRSQVREKMWELASQRKKTIEEEERTSMVTRWKCLVGMGPPIAPDELGERDMTVVHDNGYSFLVLTQPDKLFFFVFFRLDRDHHELQGAGRQQRRNRRYTDVDADALANSVAGHPIGERLVFRDIWRTRIRGSLISLEEGVLQHWSHGRIVLAGDSVHKITPNIALGGNSTMESIAVLCNHLVRTVAAYQGGRLSRPTLGQVFRQYQRDQAARMREIMELSSLITRVQAWDGMVPKFLACWVLPFQADHKLTDQLGELIRRAPKLDYVDGVRGLAAGRLPWEWELEGEKKQKKNGHALNQVKTMSWVSTSVVYLAGCVMALVFVYSLV